MKRRGFTLIELLISISIVAILAATVIMTMQGAIEQGRHARAESQIAKIYQAMSDRMQEYSTRPVPIRINPNNTPAGMTDLQYVQGLRLTAVRALMRMEFPDRKEDIDPTMAVSAPAVPGMTVPAVAQGYRRRITALGHTSSNQIWTQQFESAECLYMILAGIKVGEDSALDDFKSSEIGDVDGDGFPEILDPWGTPIQWLRWAPGLQSTPIQTKDATSQPDPFDPFKVGGNHFALFPYIYSAGPDQEYGINHVPGHAYSQTSPLTNNPYSSNAGQLIGNGALALDNIHNHLTD